MTTTENQTVTMARSLRAVAALAHVAAAHAPIRPESLEGALCVIDDIAETIPRDGTRYADPRVGWLSNLKVQLAPPGVEGMTPAKWAVQLALRDLVLAALSAADDRFSTGHLHLDQYVTRLLTSAVLHLNNAQLCHTPEIGNLFQIAGEDWPTFVTLLNDGKPFWQAVETTALLTGRG